MSKKKIIAGIMGSATLITGDGTISTFAPTISEKEEKLKELNDESKKTKENKSKIRNKRKQLNYNPLNLIKNSFVEKIYDNNKNIWKLSLVLSKNNWETIVKNFIKNDKKKFIVETKKIITDVKNNSINLSAQEFDENAIDAFAHQIWKNYDIYNTSYINLKINQQIKITSDIIGGYWSHFNFEIISEKHEKQVNKKLKFFSWLENSPIKNSFVEKIYDNNKNIWKLSLVLSKNNWETIVKNFIKNDKKKFIVETKKIITDVKNNSINLSAQEFDENAIDAFAHQIWKKFNHYYILVSKLGINQQLKIRLDIENNEWVNDNFKIIGEKTEWEKSKKDIKKIWNGKNNNEKKCKIKSNAFLWGNVVEKSTSSWMKIKINKITWDKIFLLFFLVKNNDFCIKKLIALFKTFPPSYNDSYKLNEEEIKLFVYLIWENFSYYYDCFQKLENNELIRITWKTNNATQKWSEESFENYNEIVDQNNDVIDWSTFNNRYKNENKTKLFKHDQDFDIFKRKKRPNNSEHQPGPSKEKLSKVIKTKKLGELPDANPETILQRLDIRNYLIDISQIEIESITENSGLYTAIIVPIKNSNRYTDYQTVIFTLVSQLNQSRELNDVIQRIELNVSNTNHQTILEELENLNPNLNIDEIEIGSIIDNYASIIPNSNSRYTGGVMVHLTIVDKHFAFIKYKPGGDEWKKKNIYLNEIMPIPMKFQTGDNLCTLGVLENILANNIKNNPTIKLSQEDLTDYFLISGFDAKESGLYLYNLYNFINQNIDIYNNLGFYYSPINFESDFWYNLNERLRLLWLQYLIWNSLNFGTPVATNTITSQNNGHAILIVGIEPNENPFKSLFMIRDPSFDVIDDGRHFLPNGRPNTERIINGQQLYNLLFSSSAPTYGEILINSSVYGTMFIPNIITLYQDFQDFQSLLENVSEVPIYVSDSLLSDDSICTEDDLILSGIYFDVFLPDKF